MNNKVSVGVIAVLIAAVGFLAYQNNKLNKKVEELTVTSTPEIKGPAVATSTPATSEPSPFDNPNTDPLAGKSDGQPATTTIKFEKTIHDFGRITEGDVVNTVFKFTNTGNSPLLISEAQGSCGCTVPTWPHDPIQPGASAEIAVKFDSHGKKGQNEKTVTLTSNTSPAKSVLIVKSTIIPKDK